MAGFPLTLALALLMTLSATANAATAAGILGGVLSCTNASVALAGTYSVIPNVKVDFVCGAGSGSSLPAVLQSTQTNTAGIYNFVVSSLDTVLLDGGKCYLQVTIPPVACNFNLPTSSGVLRIPVFVLSTIDALVGKILVLVPGALSIINSV